MDPERTPNPGGSRKPWVAPEITLLGEDSIESMVGETYEMSNGAYYCTKGGRGSHMITASAYVYSTNAAHDCTHAS